MLSAHCWGRNGNDGNDGGGGGQLMATAASSLPELRFEDALWCGDPSFFSFMAENSLGGGLVGGTREGTDARGVELNNGLMQYMPPRDQLTVQYDIKSCMPRLIIVIMTQFLIMMTLLDK